MEIFSKVKKFFGFVFIMRRDNSYPEGHFELSLRRYGFVANLIGKLWTIRTPPPEWREKSTISPELHEFRGDFLIVYRRVPVRVRGKYDKQAMGIHRSGCSIFGFDGAQPPEWGQPGTLPFPALRLCSAAAPSTRAR